MQTIVIPIILALFAICNSSPIAVRSEGSGGGSGYAPTSTRKTSATNTTNTTTTTSTTTTTTKTEMTAEKCAAEGGNWVAKCPVPEISCKGSGGKKECCPTQKVNQCVDNGSLSNAAIAGISCGSIIIVIYIMYRCIKNNDSYNPYG